MFKEDKFKALRELDRCIKGLECIKTENDLKKIKKYAAALVKIVQDVELQIDSRNEILPGFLMDEILDKEVS